MADITTMEPLYTDQQFPDAKADKRGKCVTFAEVNVIYANERTPKADTPPNEVFQKPEDSKAMNFEIQTPSAKYDKRYFYEEVNGSIYAIMRGYVTPKRQKVTNFEISNRKSSDLTEDGYVLMAPKQASPSPPPTESTVVIDFNMASKDMETDKNLQANLSDFEKPSEAVKFSVTELSSNEFSQPIYVNIEEIGIEMETVTETEPSPLKADDVGREGDEKEPANDVICMQITNLTMNVKALVDGAFTYVTNAGERIWRLWFQ